MCISAIPRQREHSYWQMKAMLQNAVGMSWYGLYLTQYPRDDAIPAEGGISTVVNSLDQGIRYTVSLLGTLVSTPLLVQHAKMSGTSCLSRQACRHINAVLVCTCVETYMSLHRYKHNIYALICIHRLLRNIDKRACWGLLFHFFSHAFFRLPEKSLCSYRPRLQLPLRGPSLGPQGQAAVAL